MADFYGTVAGFKTYHIDRNNEVPAATDDEDIQAALLVASEWIDGTFGESFGGVKVGGRDQVRDWPRYGAVDTFGYSLSNSAVPREVEQATYQAALRQLTTPGSLTVDFVPGKYDSISVDGAVSVTFAKFSYASDVQAQFQVINQIISPVLTATGGKFSSFSGPVARI